MGGVQTEVEAAEVGLDQGRLDRIDRHFARYVDDGRLPGWLITVSRHGRLAHVSTLRAAGHRGRLPVEPDTLWRIYSMTKPITSVAAMMLYEEGAFELTDPVSGYIPSFADARVFTGGSDIAGHRAGHRADADLAPAHPHRRPDLRLPPRRTRSTRMYRAAGLRVGAARAASTWPRSCDLLGGHAAAVPARPEWNYSVATDVLGRVVEVVSGQRLGEFLAEPDLRARWA